MGKQYMYLGNTLDFKDFRFSKGVVYFENEKIKEKMEKYPLLKKILIDISQLGETPKNERLFSTITNQLKEQIEEEDN